MTIQTRWAKIALASGAMGVVLPLLGALGSRLGAWPLLVGFLCVLAGVVLAAVALVVGGIGVATAMRQGLTSEYAALAAGIGLGLLLLSGIGGQVRAAISLPPINNISTDPDDPPTFDAIVVPGTGTRPPAYDAGQVIGTETLGELQRMAYPDVRTVRSTIGVAAGVARASAILEQMGLEVVDVDPSGGVVEATATTFWFGFKDDVVVRLRATADGALVDVRSVSRVGQGDLGANARRIRMFLERFTADDQP